MFSLTRVLAPECTARLPLIPSSVSVLASGRNTKKDMSEKKVTNKREGFSPRGVRHFFRNLGPGLITGAADDDPSGISTYSVTGASFGYAPLWTALFSFPLMAAVQMMCARLGW